jgi:hypothetical protein
MGRTACTEPQCLYKGALYLFTYQCGHLNFNTWFKQNVSTEWKEMQSRYKQHFVENKTEIMQSVLKM